MPTGRIGTTANSPNTGHPNSILSNYLGGAMGVSARDAAGALTDWRPNVGRESDLARDHMNTALRGFTQEGFRLRDEEDRRQQEALGFLTDQFHETTKPTLTDQDIGRMYTAEADDAAGDQNEMLRMLRSTMGGAGVTGGGTAAGIAANMRRARLGTLVGAKGNLRSFKAMHDADQASRQFQQALSLRSAMAEGPSGTGLGVLGELTGVRLSQLGIELGREGSHEMAEATKDAGELAAIGGIVGGGFSALGPLIG